MSHGVCPPWLSFVLANPLRRWGQDPDRILRPYVSEGDTAADIGCGPGFFTVEMARLVGPSGRVVALDLQPGMLDRARRVVTRAGLASRVAFVQSTETDLCVPGPLDFALAFAVIHEMPSAARAFEQIAAALRTGGQLLIAEPRGHVSPAAFAETIGAAAAVGLEHVGSPEIRVSHTALLRKS